MGPRWKAAVQIQQICRHSCKATGQGLHIDTFIQAHEGVLTDLPILGSKTERRHCNHSFKGIDINLC